MTFTQAFINKMCAASPQRISATSQTAKFINLLRASGKLPAGTVTGADLEYFRREFPGTHAIARHAAATGSSFVPWSNHPSLNRHYLGVKH